MSEKKEKAIRLFKEGYNCTQAVVLAFEEELGADRNVAVRMSSAFGGGMGRLREVCGAVSGMLFVIGFLYGEETAMDVQVKGALYERVQEVAKSYEKKNGSIVCRELLGLNQKREQPKPEERTQQYYKKRPCPELVGCAAEIVERYIEEHQIEKHQIEG